MTTSTDSLTAIYNALDQRIVKASSLATTVFVYDEAGHMLGEYDGSGNLIEETVWMGDLPVATLQPNGSGGINVFYVHADHLNTPKTITRPSDSAIVWRWDQDPFGTVAPNPNPSGIGTFPYNLRYPGQYYDFETGLSQNYFRDFDPAVGKYVESDPIGLAGGINTYAYVRDNPLSLTDPTGLIVQRCCRKARIALGLVNHCWLKTDTITAGMNATAQCSRPGENRSDMPWVTPVVVSDASCEPGNNCQTINDVDEQCVNRELAIGKSLGQFGFLNNCQTFAWEVLTKCSKNPKLPTISPRSEGR